MKVGIDTFGCDHGRSGIGSYLLSLVGGLPEDDGISFELFGPEMDRYTYTGDKPYGWKSISVPDSIVAERMWHTFKVNSFGRKQDYDVILYTAGAQMLPGRFKVPGVVVVNGIVSNQLSKTDDMWVRAGIRRRLSKADCIIAASQFIKKDLERHGFKGCRIEVIHNGIDHSMFFPAQVVDSESDVIDIKPFSIKKPYIIYASRMHSEEKKHLELIKAFTLFKERTGLPHRLVLAGSEGAYYDAVKKAVFASSAASDIIITGFFAQENFTKLYRNAEACVFPSVNEGVGLPVIEAMAVGIPVTCSRAGALGEIAGEHALFFDSDNIEEMSACLEKILCDQKLRKELVSGGLEWARRFSWEKTAASTVEVLRSVADMPRGGNG
ncbi:MAG: glycosyltransferase family 4 protein [Treponema sp.]|nr:glycosyltransferase family 4 protein [Treponema sp.]